VISFRSSGGNLDVDGSDILLQPRDLRGAGMGTIEGCRASSQASATWALVAFLRAAMSDSKSTRA